MPEPSPAVSGRPPEEAPGLLVSVVIPTFNGARYLREAIDSVLAQDYPSIECIVVDAASTDGTQDILTSYGDRITWTSRSDRGAFDAINDGWKLSKGEVLAWLNSDDVWEPGAAKLAAQYFEDHPDVDVLYGTCGGIDEQGRVVREYPARRWDLRFAVQHCDHIIHQAASFMRRSAIERVGYLYPDWCHDHDLWLRIGVAGGVFHSTSTLLASARLREGNLGHNPTVIVRGKLGLTRRFFETPGLPEGWHKLRSQAISNAYLRCIQYLRPRRPLHWLIAVRLLIQAVVAQPLNTPHILTRLLIEFLAMLKRPLAWLGRTVSHAAAPLARRCQAITRARAFKPATLTLSSLATVAIATAAMLTAGGSTLTAASTFVLVALPLTATLLLYAFSSRS